MDIFDFLSEYKMELHSLNVLVIRDTLIRLRIKRTWLYYEGQGTCPYCVHGKTYEEALGKLCETIQGRTLVFEDEKKGDLRVEVPFPLTYSV